MYFSKLKINILEIDYASRKIYGLIIMLSLIVTLQNYNYSGLTIIFGIFGTLFVIALAEIYVKIIYYMSKHKKRIPKKKLNILLKEEFSILFALDLPVVVYILYVLEFLNLSDFVLVVKIGGVMLLFFYGYKLGYLLQKNIIRRFCLGLISAFFGMIIIFLKLYFKI